jgi:hypothetical protein
MSTKLAREFQGPITRVLRDRFMILSEELIMRTVVIAMILAGVTLAARSGGP